MLVNPNEDFCIVWHAPSPRPIGGQLYIGTHFLTGVGGSGVGGYHELAWDSRRESPPAGSIERYKVFLVNMFADQEHIAQIRMINPEAHIVALPDAYFEHAFVSPYARKYYEQLDMADRLAYVSFSNARFYQNIPWTRPKAPFWQISIPAGPLWKFGELRDSSLVGDGDPQYIISLDHGERAYPYLGVQNILVIQALQKQFPLNVIYVNPLESTKRAAEAMGLSSQIRFMPYVDYGAYCTLSAKATLGIDLYALHGYGRNELTWALCGLPYIGSAFTEFQGPYNTFFPFDVSGAIRHATWLLEDYHNSVPGMITAGVKVAEDLASIINCNVKINNYLSAMKDETP